MGDYLFANFLTNPKEYARAEEAWRKHWLDLLRLLDQESLWQTPWVNTTFAGGTAFQDGNPIFSAVEPRRRLGIRIIQLEPEDDPEEFAVWTDTFAEGMPEAVKELVISCVLTNQALLQAVELMRQWITEEKVRLPWDASEESSCPKTAETLSIQTLSDPPTP